jgi:arylsulfatase A-like enzyme
LLPGPRRRPFGDSLRVAPVRVLRALITLSLLGSSCTRDLPQHPGVAAERTATPTPEAAARRPNVLVIVTDDQRADTLEVMPETQAWFAAQGTSFAQGFASTPLCCPSRASIFTGRYTHNHGVLNNSMASQLNHRSTLQRYLQEAGYRTAIAGKFLNGWNLFEDPPYFDRWAIFDENASYYEVPFNVNGEIQTVRGYSTSFIEDQAIRFLSEFERTDARPWLLYVTVFAPHTPYTAAPKYDDSPVPEWKTNPAVKEKDLSDKPPWLREAELGPTGGEWTRREQLQTLMSVDDLIGRLTRQLDHLDEQEPTLAFFLSDNGYFWAEHGLLGKSHPYTQAVQIPFLLRWDGHVVAGAEDDSIVSTVDVAPTVLAAAGIRPSTRYPVDGRNLIGSSPRVRVLLEYFTDPVRPAPDWASIRTSSYQYVEHYGTGGRAIFREYYDLVQDPWQLANDLVDGHPNDPPPEQTEKLSRILARGRRCRGTEGPRACP